MSEPKIIKKNSDNETSQVIPTELVSVVTVPLCINGPGDVTVSVFESVDSGGNGGIILRIALDKQDSGFQPVVITNDGYVEVHIAGSIEANQTIKALKAALSTI